MALIPFRCCPLGLAKGGLVRKGATARPLPAVDRPDSKKSSAPTGRGGGPPPPPPAGTTGCPPRVETPKGVLKIPKRPVVLHVTAQRRAPRRNGLREHRADCVRQALRRV